MVGPQSLAVVNAEMNKLGIRAREIVIGEAEVPEELTPAHLLKLRIALRQSGLQLM
jgi:hypothetical protein